jgi:flap endonuclease-1
MAIDVYNYLYRIWYVSQTKVIKSGLIEPDHNQVVNEVLGMIHKFINKLVYYQIHPIFVFEGKAHEDKLPVQEKRREIKMKYKQRIESLKNIEINGNIDIIDEQLRNLYCRDINIYEQDIINIRNTLMSYPGITVLNARYEAEQLCSSLYIEGKVQSVYSTDTDNLVYGCGLLLTNIDDHGCFVGYSLHNILLGLGLTFEQFRDLCILMGCDYNTNIRGIGPIKSYELIHKYKSIDKLPKSYDKSYLNYERCRNIFEYKPSVDLII